MPTITESTSITLTAGQAISFSPVGVGSVLVDEGGRNLTFAIGQQEVQLGPWATDVVLKITVTDDSLVYTLDADGSFAPPAVVISTDAPVNGDGRPNGTIYQQTGVAIFVKSADAYVRTPPALPAAHVVSDDPPSDEDEAPDGTVYMQLGVGVFVKDDGAYVQTPPAPALPVVSASAPSDEDGLPDGTVHIQTGVAMFVKSAGAYVQTPPASGG